jgi:hypothetical protein
MLARQSAYIDVVLWRLCKLRSARILPHREPSTAPMRSSDSFYGYNSALRILGVESSAVSSYMTKRKRERKRERFGTARRAGVGAGGEALRLRTRLRACDVDIAGLE